MSFFVEVPLKSESRGRTCQGAGVNINTPDDKIRSKLWLIIVDDNTSHQWRPHRPGSETSIYAHNGCHRRNPNSVRKSDPLKYFLFITLRFLTCTLYRTCIAWSIEWYKRVIFNLRYARPFNIFIRSKK